MKKYPLSKTEYGIYIEQTTRKDCAYNIPYLITLPENVDFDRFEQAVRASVKAHPGLLVSFGVDENGEVYKTICDDAVQIERVITDDFDPYDYVLPFDLHSDRLFRFYLVKTPSQDYFLLDVHHIVFDMTSALVLVSEIDRVYGGEEPIGESFSACDFALEEQQRLSGEEYAAAKAYYKSVFDGVDTDTAFFADKNTREHAMKELVYKFESVDSDALKTLAKKNGVKLSSVFNAAFAFLLSKYTNSAQVLYSTVHHGRDSRLNNTVGMFVKTYPVYSEISDSEDTDGFLKKLDSRITLNRENDLYSFADFCSDFKLNPSVLFAYQGDAIHKVTLCGAESTVELLPMKDPKSGFELTIRREDGRFTAYAEYEQDVYNDEIIAAML